ncbi:MAG: radical SAM protein [Dehalococcoidia bacterium]|nr:radical SAM protein [Dehalococcoidia bacterium]
MLAPAPAPCTEAPLQTAPAARAPLRYHRRTPGGAVQQPVTLAWETLPGRPSVPAAGGGGARVLLVSAYELGHQPLGLAAPAAALRAAGHEVRTLDLAVDAPAPAVLRDVDLVAISMPMHTAARIGLAFARAARAASPAITIACYGLYASPLHAQLVGPDRADLVIGGEYEAGLCALADRVAGRTARDAAIPGAGAIPLRTRPRAAVPDRRGLPGLDRYARVRRADGEHAAGYVEASRGCAHRCTHCPITPVYGGALRLVPREAVLADVAQQVAAGARHITFGDPDFLNAVPHSLAIAEELHRRWPDLTYDATIKVEHLIDHAAVLPALRDSGCLFITSAFESCNDAILATLEKGHTAADLPVALRAAERAGLPVRPTWVAFTPWTSMEDLLAILDFVAEQGLVRHVQPVQYGLRLLLPPGSPLVERLAHEGRLGPFDGEGLTYIWRAVDARVDALQAEIAALVEAAAQPAAAAGCDCGDDACARAAEPEDAAITFTRVRRAAYAAAGREPPPPLTAPAGTLAGAPAVVIVPGLTEAWFCCAEPTARQLAPFAL